jgi:hypothetical protein
MLNSTLGKKKPNTNQKFLNWLYYLKNGYNKEEYNKVIQEENATDTANATNAANADTANAATIKQIKKDIAMLNLTVKSSNSFVNLTKNTILSYIIILILFLIILYLHIHVLAKAAKVITKDLFSIEKLNVNHNLQNI